MMGEVSRTKLTISIVSGAWSLALLVLGVELPAAAPRVLFALPTALLLLFALFNNWLWHVGPVRAIVGRPLLTGTWTGHLVSMRSTVDDGEATHDPIPIFLVIRESYLEVSVTLISAESRSRSIAAVLQTEQERDFVIHYLYSNLPRLTVRDHSPQHTGGGRLDVSGLKPSSLTGEYWTDRRTRGSLDVQKLSSKLVGSFQEGNTLMTRTER
jgi:hypothetical protein